MAVREIACEIVESGQEAAQAVNVYREELFPYPFKPLTLPEQGLERCATRSPRSAILPILSEV